MHMGQTNAFVAKLKWILNEKKYDVNWWISELSTLCQFYNEVQFIGFSRINWRKEI